LLFRHLSSGYASYYYRDILTYVCGISATFALLMILYIKPFSRTAGMFQIHLFNNNIVIIITMFNYINMKNCFLVFDTLRDDDDEGFIETPNAIDGNSSSNQSQVNVH